MSEQHHTSQQAHNVPPIIINNSASASASANAGRLPRKRHSVIAHVVLFFLTAGIGNLIYWWWIANENKKRGY